MFSSDTISYLKDLKANNTRDWFQSEKKRYEAHVKTPAKLFCAQTEAALSHLYGMTPKSRIFRINRDVRFSKDKTPYNTHVHISFADPATRASWMVGLEIDRLVIGYGLFAFDKGGLTRWRVVVAGSAGPDLQASLDQFVLDGGRIEEPELKRVPAPYNTEHPMGALLRRKGLALWEDRLPQNTTFGEDAPQKIAKAMATFDPVRDWMAKSL